MKEAILAGFIFWGAFAVSPGPWWIAFMEAAKDTPLRVLYRNMSIYCIVGELPFIYITCGPVALLGGVHPLVLHILHFVGAAFMLYLAAKTLAAKLGKSRKFNYDWRSMTLVHWTNPKAWITIPIGSLTATYTDSLPLNLFGFYIIGLLVMFPASYLWATIGREGAKMAHGKLSYLNAFLFAAFAFYLLWRGVVGL